MIDNISFASMKEGERYLILRSRLRRSQIASLDLQPSYEVNIKNKKICVYRADFRYWDCVSGERVVEDVKGFKTPVYRLKKKLVEAIYDIKITEI